MNFIHSRRDAYHWSHTVTVNEVSLPVMAVGSGTASGHFANLTVGGTKSQSLVTNEGSLAPVGMLIKNIFSKIYSRTIICIIPKIYSHGVNNNISDLQSKC